MLPKKNRISKKDFPSSQRQGIRVFSAFFSAVFYKNEGEVRVAVVISKKTAKTAVLRNLLRRRFYHAIQENHGRFIQKGSLVIYPKKEAGAAPFSVIKKEITEALNKAKLIL